ncbi:MAG: hypothetical protein KDA24_15830 [Deltaproteobacteria bacterium]|nr:hypothetical protein [Deltaproteobacteria bacterium]
MQTRTRWPFAVLALGALVACGAPEPSGGVSALQRPLLVMESGATRATIDADWVKAQAPAFAWGQGQAWRLGPLFSDRWTDPSYELRAVSAKHLARMLQMLLAKHGGIYMLPDDFEKLPLHIPRITAQELIKQDLPDVVVERVVLEYVTRAKHCKELQIINGLKPGMLTRALNGEDVGSIIYQG